MEPRMWVFRESIQGEEPKLEQFVFEEFNLNWLSTDVMKCRHQPVTSTL